MFQQLLIFSFIGQLANRLQFVYRKNIFMNRILSHIPQHHGVIGIHTRFHNFTWKFMGEIEKEIAWY